MGLSTKCGGARVSHLPLHQVPASSTLHRSVWQALRLLGACWLYTLVVYTDPLPCVPALGLCTHTHTYTQTRTHTLHPLHSPNPPPQGIHRAQFVQLIARMQALKRMPGPMSGMGGMGSSMGGMAPARSSLMGMGNPMGHMGHMGSMGGAGGACAAVHIGQGLGTYIRQPRC